MKAADLRGQVFGDLLVVRATKKRLQGSVVWVCKCFCGESIKVSVKELRRGRKTKGCECTEKLVDVGDITVRWWSQVCKITGSKKRRGLSKTLTMNQAWWLFQDQDQRCVYSGVPLVISEVRVNNTASIDRINSDLGYDMSNVQWVHKEVNMMKRVLTHSQFINWCDQITKHQESKR